MKTATPRIEPGQTFKHHCLRFRIEGLTQEQPPRVQVVQLTDGGTPPGTTWRFTERSVHLLLAGKNPKFRTFDDLPEIVNRETSPAAKDAATTSVRQGDM